MSEQEQNQENRGHQNKAPQATAQAARGQEQQAVYHNTHDYQEISLVDMALIVRRIFKQRKRLWLGLTLLLLVLGVTLASLRSQHYNYQELVQLPAVATLGASTGTVSSVVAFDAINAQYKASMLPQLKASKTPYINALQVDMVANQGLVQFVITASARHAALAQNTMQQVISYFKQQALMQFGLWSKSQQQIMKNMQLQMQQLRGEIQGVFKPGQTLTQAQGLYLASAEQKLQSVQDQFNAAQWQLQNSSPFSQIVTQKIETGLSVAGGIQAAIFLALLLSTIAVLLVHAVASFRRQIVEADKKNQI